jgi:hypothetical protein
MEMPTIARARREPEVKAQGSRGGPLPAVLIISPSLLLADRRISGSHTLKGFASQPPCDISISMLKIFLAPF